jgi:hypothetical protein
MVYLVVIREKDNEKELCYPSSLLNGIAPDFLKPTQGNSCVLQSLPATKLRSC